MKQTSQYQTIKQEGILLNANESSVNLPLSIREEIAQAIQETAFNRYPQDDYTALREAYAGYLGLQPEQVIAGNGSDEMLGLMISLYIGKGKKLYTFAPDFSMYDYYCGMHDGEMCRWTIKAGEPLDVDGFIAYGKREQVSMVLFSNPNNPTGNSIPKTELCRIVEAFSEIPVIIDEAYAEFDDSTITDMLARHENLFVTRTLSKAFALAAVRCGFLLGNAQAMAKIRAAKVPYNVNTLTETAARIVLAHHEEITAAVNALKQRRDEMGRQLQVLQDETLTFYPSKANYFYGRCTKKAELLSAFNDAGIQIRSYADEGFRITVGTETENELVLNVLKTFRRNA